MPCVEGLCCNLHDLFTSQNLAAAEVVIFPRGHSTSHAMQGNQHSCRATAPRCLPCSDTNTSIRSDGAASPTMLLPARPTDHFIQKQPLSHLCTQSLRVNRLLWLNNKGRPGFDSNERLNIESRQSFHRLLLHAGSPAAEAVLRLLGYATLCNRLSPRSHD
jgi:hypothetical protein